LVKLCPSSGASPGGCLYSRAYLADATTLLNSVRAYTAIVPIRAPAAMEFRGSQPFRLQHLAAQLSDALAKIAPGGVAAARTSASTDTAHTETPPDVLWPWPAFMALSTPAAMGFMTPQPFRLKHNSAQFSHSAAEVRPSARRWFARNNRLIHRAGSPPVRPGLTMLIHRRAAYLHLTPKWRSSRGEASARRPTRVADSGLKRLTATPGLIGAQRLLHLVAAPTSKSFSTQQILY